MVANDTDLEPRTPENTEKDNASCARPQPQRSQSGLVSNPSASSNLGGSARPRRVGDIRRNSTIFAKIDVSPLFQNTTLAVICFNATWIFVDVQFNHSSLADSSGRLPLEPASTTVENLFCFYFTVEVVIRWLAFKKKCCDPFMDAWFVFDSVLVSFMIVETWAIPLAEKFSDSSKEGGGGVLSNFSSFRLLRLLRLTRMARIMRFFPELLTIVRGIVNATRAVFFILLFLILVMYIFAIIFTSQLGTPGGRFPEPGREEEEDLTARMLFDSLGSSMMTLFTRGVLGDNLMETIDAIKYAKQCHTYMTEPFCPSSCAWIDDECKAKSAAPLEGPILTWVFLLFCSISSITLLNMLIGVLCQVVDDTARAELEANQVKELQCCLTEAFQSIDRSQDGVITPSEWLELSDSEPLRNSLEALGVERAHLDDRLQQMRDTLFGHEDLVRPMEAPVSPAGGSPRDGLSFEQFINKVADLRWDAPTSALDLEMLKRTVMTEQTQLKARFDGIEAKLEVAMRVLNTAKGTPDGGGGGTGCCEPVRSRPASAGQATTRTAGGGGLANGGRPDQVARGGVAEAFEDTTQGFLRTVPTELLFHILGSRAAQVETQAPP
eukprot:TRINITY_DN8716_c0_g1_i1.p1 TRINITY_DN8716_c0_g1~~TRINITY_DN8716_c0_g1_i1.p1  ORF type:complete len:608 (+),score=138.43 TRINITY_DN8716_c0_g1_i1:123-1946(+)